MSEKEYAAYLRSGPTGDVSKTERTLRWAEENPADALRVRRRHAEESREKMDKDVLRHAFLADGGSEADFERHYPKMRDEHNAARLREMDRSGRAAVKANINRAF